MKRCTKCNETKPTSEFYKDKRHLDGLRYWCKSCGKADSKKWDVLNKEKTRVSSSKYRERNKDKYARYEAQRRTHKLNATVKWANLEAIERMYIVSDFLSNKLGEPHHVDHIVPLKGANICGLHVEYNLDVIPAIDNLRKGNR